MNHQLRSSRGIPEVECTRGSDRNSTDYDKETGAKVCTIKNLESRYWTICEKLFRIIPYETVSYDPIQSAI